MQQLVKSRMVFLHDADVVERTPAVLGGLAESMEVTVPPYPGFEGQFDALDRSWEKWDSAADLAHHFKRAILSEDKPIHLAGAGFGGWVALELALIASRSLASLVLVAPYGVKLFGRTERDFADILLLDPEEQIEKGWSDTSRCRGLRMPGYPEGLPDEQYEIAFAERATLARYIWKPFLYSKLLTRWVDTIELPTLVVTGSDDGMLHRGHSRALADRLPQARYVEIPAAGHYPYLEQPEAFSQTVLEFYRELGVEQ